MVIVPMAFSEPRYLEEVRAGLGAGGRRVLHFCLTAPLAVVQARLTARGEPDVERNAWVHRRAEECCRAHLRPEFAVHVPTEHAPSDVIAAGLAKRIAEAS